MTSNKENKEKGKKAMAKTVDEVYEELEREDGDRELMSCKNLGENSEGRLRQETAKGEEQFGFMLGRGTTDVIFVLKQLMKRMQAELHMVFIDLEKVYNRLSRQEVWRCTRVKRIPEKYVRLVKEMYKRAMTQGSTLSPFLFDLVMDVLVEDRKSKEFALWSMLFVDDIVLSKTSRDKVEKKLENGEICWKREA
ncbi:uncharacterized protein [Centruroides vittatus]|uniref:uncharacterized protein n=1 Tax=Centruroides vittatus TaxID=120091 RepID=UPI00350F2532